jgi:RNA polymerase subunit RPABC4/transcription elongation factor Spt4
MTESVCRECHASLAAIDRFCPACGTPNTGGKLHPRLAPALVEHEAYLDLTVGSDEPACPRCHRAIAPDDPFCRTCGFSTDLGNDPWREAARALTDPPPSGGARPAAAVSLWLRWVFRCLIAASAVAAVASLGLTLVLRDLRLRPTSDGFDRVATLTDVRATSVALLAGLGLLTAAVSVVWVRRALADNEALGAGPPRLTRAWVAPGLLIPGVNLVVPPLLLDEVWRGSDPAAPRLDEGRWRSRPGPTLMWLGWALLLLFWALLGVGSAWSTSPDALANDQFAATLDTVGFSVLFVSLVVLHVASMPLTERQELRAHRLGFDIPPVVADADVDVAALSAVLRDGGAHGRY